MHDDRIAGVTFEENASRNALIVNEEYAWVGNPFSALRVRREDEQRTDQSWKALYISDMQGSLLYFSALVEARLPCCHEPPSSLSSQDATDKCGTGPAAKATDAQRASGPHPGCLLLLRADGTGLHGCRPPAAGALHDGRRGTTVDP